MTIACLGWGSLIWNPRNLPLQSHWHKDGPSLPVEFARKSADGRITLVIAPDSKVLRVLWAALDVSTVDEARQTLADREGIRPENMGRYMGAWSSDRSSGHPEVATIGEWAIASGISGAVWTALPPKFSEVVGKPSWNQVIRYLAQLTGDTKRLAEEYVRRAPSQIRTPYREKIERELGWTPLE
jgi:hypothetical protein